MPKNNLKEVIATLWLLFVFFVISMELYGDIIVKLIRELFLLLFIALLLFGLIFGGIWLFYLRDRGGWSA